MAIIAIVIFVILVLFLMDSYTEAFENQCTTNTTNTTNTTCTSCTAASGCAWCPDTNQCIDNHSLCTPISHPSIHTSMNCSTVPPILPDLPFYQDAIADKPKPPNIGLRYKI